MHSKLFDLSGKVAVVTGATGVLGATISHALAASGATVIPLAQNQAKVKALAAALGKNGTIPMSISADITDADAIEAAATQIFDQYGKVDILINGAGGNHPDATTIPEQHTFFDIPPQAMRWVVDLNFTSTVLVAQVFGARMAECGEGVILNISSMASYQPMTRVPAYSGAKAAINNFTYWLAVYMATEHSAQIRVNAIAPGFFLGGQNRFLLIDKDSGDLTPRGQQIIAHTPMQRFGDPEDLVGTVLWLVSDASQFVTGIVVPVDGGFMAYAGV